MLSRVLLSLLLSFPGFLMAADVKLAWDANQESDLAGYRLYWKSVRAASYGHPNMLTISDPAATITGLNPGQYWFVVTAFNTAGTESGYSNEVTTTVISSCDINGDGSIDAIDVQLMTNTVLGLAACPTCDFNGDGETNVFDLQQLINVVLGVASCQ